jgi:hypothetical protein
MKIKVIFIALVLALATMATLFAGCSFDRWVEIAEGDYVPIDAVASHDDSGTRLIESMTIDHDKNIVEIHLRNGSIIDANFTSRPKKEWPSGCPANFGSTRMEVLDITEGKLTIGSIVINSPIVVRNCPSNPELILLREDGQIGGAGTACAGIDKCIHFRRAPVN